MEKVNQACVHRTYSIGTSQTHTVNAIYGTLRCCNKRAACYYTVIPLGLDMSKDSDIRRCFIGCGSSSGAGEYKGSRSPLSYVS